MAWINVVPDGSIRFYSLSGSIETIKDFFISFWMNLSPAYILLLLVVFIGLIIGGVVWSIYNSVKQGYVIR